MPCLGGSPPTSHKVHVRRTGTSTLSQGAWVWVCERALRGKGVLSKVGPRLPVPQAVRRGSAHPPPWPGMSGLEKNSLVFINLSLMDG